MFILNDNWFSSHNPMSSNWLILMNILKSFHIGSHSRTFGTIWQHRQVLPLITDELSLLVNYRVKLTGMPQEDLRRINHPYAEARRICSTERTLPACCVCPRHGTKFYVVTRFWHARWDPTIVMAVHNNDNILMVHYEDLPDEGKNTINKATEEF